MPGKEISLSDDEWALFLSGLERRVSDIQYAARSYELYGDFEGNEEVESCREARELAARYLAIIRKIESRLRLLS